MESLFGGGGGDTQPLFTSQKKASKALKQLFGKRGMRELTGYLGYPLPVTGGESYEAGFFGTGPDQELYDIFGMGKRKKRNRALRDYYKNYDYEAAAERAKASPFNQLLGSTTDRISTNVLPNVDELLRTGFRSDISSLIAEEQRRLNQDILPGVAERFRTALTGSGFQHEIGQSLEDLGVRLGTLNFNADEAAADRRTNAILSGGASQAYQTPLNLLLGGALATGSAGQRARGRFETTRPGARLYESLLGLGGLEMQGGFQTSGSGGGLSGLTDLIGAGMSLYGQGGFGGGGGAASGGGGGGGGGLASVFGNRGIS